MVAMLVYDPTGGIFVGAYFFYPHPIFLQDTLRMPRNLQLQTCLQITEDEQCTLNASFWICYVARPVCIFFDANIHEFRFNSVLGATGDSFENIITGFLGCRIEKLFYSTLLYFLYSTSQTGCVFPNCNILDDYTSSRGFQEGRKTMQSWNKGGCKSKAEAKDMKKFAQSCMPILIRYENRFVVRRLTVLKYHTRVWQGDS